MTLLPRGLKVHLALGYTDMRKGIDGLAMLVQAVLRQDPFSGHLFVFRGRKVCSGTGQVCAPFKYPRWIEFVDELPKTASGKIQRFKLRAANQPRAHRGGRT
jgi:acyl-CoA synthetase (AMP-forming)/AMP-acid ligase II